MEAFIAFLFGAPLSLGALSLCCCPLPGADEEAASVLSPLYSSSLAKQNHTISQVGRDP